MVFPTWYPSGSGLSWSRHRWMPSLVALVPSGSSTRKWCTKSCDENKERCHVVFLVRTQYWRQNRFHVLQNFAKQTTLQPWIWHLRHRWSTAMPSGHIWFQVKVHGVHICRGFRHHGINMLNSHSSNWGPLSEFNTLCTLGCRGWTGKQMLCLYKYKYRECFRDLSTKDGLCSEEPGNSRVLRSDTMPGIFLIRAGRVSSSK